MDEETNQKAELIINLLSVPVNTAANLYGLVLSPLQDLMVFE